MAKDNKEKSVKDEYDDDLAEADAGNLKGKDAGESEGITEWPQDSGEDDSDEDEKPSRKAAKEHRPEHKAEHKTETHHKQSKSSDNKKSESHKSREKSEDKAESKSNAKYWIIAVVIIAILGIAAVVVFMDKLITEKPAVQTEMGTLVLTVNGEPVYSKEIEKKLSYLQAQYGPSIDEDFVINQTISELLLLQEAKRQNIKIDEKVIDDAVNQWVAQVKDSVTTEQLDEILQKENLTMAQFIEDTRKAYKDNFLIYELLNRSVFVKLDLAKYEDNTVTEEEIQKEFADNPDTYNQINVSHILICYQGAQSCASNRTKEEAEKLVNEIYNKLLNNADFIALAKQYSDDAGSSASGGELGWISKDQQFDETFLAQAFALKNVNQFSMPFHTLYGYHIVKLNDKMNKFEDFAIQISMQLQYEKQFSNQNEMLKVQQEAVVNYLKELKKDAVVINYKQQLTEAIETNVQIKTFSKTNNEVCRDADGKPIIRLYTTTSCPHCEWVGATYDKVVKEYVASGKIAAYHWDLQANDDLLTPAIEGVVLPSEMEIYTRFNPKGTIPTFVFGCRYYRIGNGYEQEKSLPKEEAEFRAVIDQLVG